MKFAESYLSTAKFINQSKIYLNADFFNSSEIAEQAA